MAAEQIHPQPVLFNRTRSGNDCDCDNSIQDDQLLAEQGDITQWQFSNAPCAYKLNEFFLAGLIGSWVTTGNQNCHNAGSPGAIIGMTTLLDNNPMQIIVDVSFPNGDNGTVQVILGSLVLGEITTAGRYFFYYNNVIPGFNRLDIGVDANFDGCIDQVQVLSFSQLWRVWVKDKAGVIVDEWDIDSQIWRIQNRFITFRLDWQAQGIADGCYTICLADPCVNTCSQNQLVGQNFRDTTKFAMAVTGGGSLVIVPQAGFMQWGLSGLGDTGTATAAKTVCDGTTYEITFTTSSIINSTVQLSLGGTLGTLRSTNGTFTEQILSTGTDFVLSLAGTGASSLMLITNMTVKAITADLVPDFTSEQINLQADLDCTKILNWCNNKNEDYNMGWELTNFSPNIRFDVRQYHPEFNIEERVVNEDSNGRKTNDYVRFRLRKKMTTAILPDYQIEAMYLGLLSDNFYIDGEEKFLETDEIPVTWLEDNSNRGTLSAIIGNQEQKFENKRCTNEIHPCPEILGANLRAGQFLLILGDGSTLNIYK